MTYAKLECSKHKQQLDGTYVSICGTEKHRHDKLQSTVYLNTDMNQVFHKNEKVNVPTSLNIRKFGTFTCHIESFLILKILKRFSLLFIS